MSTTQDDLETQSGETQETQEAIETQGDEIQAVEDDEDGGNEKKGKGKEKEKKEPIKYEPQPGKTVLPSSRVTKVLKADRELPLVQKEAHFLISVCCEQLIQRFTQAGHRIASRENRSTVQYKDMAICARKIDEFLFMEEVIPWVPVVSEKDKSKPKPAQKPKPQAESKPGEDSGQKASVGTTKSGKLSAFAFVPQGQGGSLVAQNEDVSMEDGEQDSEDEVPERVL